MRAHNLALLGFAALGIAAPQFGIGEGSVILIPGGNSPSNPPITDAAMEIFEIGGCKDSDVIGLRATLTSLLLIYGNRPPFEIWNLEQAIIAALKACGQDIGVGPIIPDQPIPGGPLIPDKPAPGGPIIPDQPVPGGPIVTQSPVPGGPITPSD